MTALASADGRWHDYVELALVLTDIGAQVSSDLAALFRRVAFSVAIHNTDDHMRNHGFLHASGAWVLAPMFDVNPDPNPGTSRVTGVAGSITRDEERAGLDELARACRLSAAEAARIRAEVADAVDELPTLAGSRGIAESEIRQFVEAVVDVRP